MRAIVVGLGIQGGKRAKVIEEAGDQLVATVDPVNPNAAFKDIRDVPLANYDAAFVCTPDGAKFEVLSYLLSNKKHVLVEKPILAESNEQIEKLRGLARANRVTCYTAYNHRFEPHIARLKEVLDSGQLGKPYFAKIFYGNGTARDVRNSAWRDQGDGVLPDLGSHLLDMVLFLFGKPEKNFERWSFNAFENRAFDHVMFACQGTPHIQLEATLLSWRNTFRLDVFCEKGTAHIDCLCKWGPSTLTVRGRVLPSGRPTEEKIPLECADPTWRVEHDRFKALCQRGETNLDNDLWINSVLNSLGGAR